MLINGYTDAEIDRLNAAARPWSEVEAEGAAVGTAEQADTFMARLVTERPYLQRDLARSILLNCDYPRSDSILAD